MSLHVKDTDIMFVKFNRGGRKLLIGKKSGIRLYDLEKLEVQAQYDMRDVYLAELLGATRVVAAACIRKPSVLRLVNVRSQKEVHSLCYATSILSLASNDHVLVVCMEDVIEILTIKGLKVLNCVTVKSGYGGLCALSPLAVDGCCYLAYPDSELEGKIHVLNVYDKKDATPIDTHKSPLAVMAFHPKQNILATSSTKGTLIRLYAVPGGECLLELRRGLQRSVSMYSLEFSADGSLLCCSSNTGTIHVFRIDLERNDRDEDEIECGMTSVDSMSSVYIDADEHYTSLKPTPQRVAAPTNRAVQTWGSYLAEWIPTSFLTVPRTIYDSYVGQRSFLKARISQGKNYSHFLCVGGIQKLLAASNDGWLYIFNMEGGTTDGECPRASNPLALDGM